MKRALGAVVVKTRIKAGPLSHNHHQNLLPQRRATRCLAQAPAADPPFRHGAGWKPLLNGHDRASAAAYLWCGAAAAERNGGPGRELRRSRSGDLRRRLNARCDGPGP